MGRRLLVGMVLLASGCGGNSSEIMPVAPSTLLTPTPPPPTPATASVDIVSLLVVRRGPTPSGYRHDVELTLTERTGRGARGGAVAYRIPGEYDTSCSVGWAIPYGGTSSPAGYCLDFYTRAPATFVDVTVHYFDDAGHTSTVTGRAVIQDP